MVRIFDGEAFARKKKEKIKRQVDNLRKKGITLTLATLYLPEDVGSTQYTKKKKEAASEVGINFLEFEIKDSSDIPSIILQIERLNQDPAINGVLLQRPLGKLGWNTLDWSRLVESIDPKKDVDGLTPTNLGLTTLGTPRFLPATVKAVLDILRFANIQLVGKAVAIVGASEIFGKPAAMLFTEKDATVTVLHTKTRDFATYTQNADILISATGQKNLISPDMVKKGVVIIDIGAPDPDVQKETAQKAEFVTPVPGGVGPVTVACLLENTAQTMLNYEE